MKGLSRKSFKGSGQHLPGPCHLFLVLCLSLALALEKHGAAHSCDAVIDAACGHALGMTELLGRQVGGDDGGLAAFIPGVDEAVDLLQGVFALSLNAEIVDEHQVIAGQAVIVGITAPVFIELAGHVVSQPGETGAQDVIALVVQGVYDTAGGKGFSSAHIAVKQQADVLSEVFLKLRHVSLCLFDGPGAGAIVGLKGHSAQGGVVNMGCFSDFLPLCLLVGLKRAVTLVAGFGSALAQAGYFFWGGAKGHPCLHGGVAKRTVFESVLHIEFRAAGVGIGDSDFKIHRLSPLLAV